MVTISGRGTVLRRVEKTVAWWRNNKGTGRLWRSFYRGTEAIRKN